MQRVLVLFEKGRTAHTPDLVIRLARGAEMGGVDVRLRSLGAAGIDDVRWAQALVLALAPARGREMPWAVKRWMDALGFVGWGSFEGKSGYILTGDPASAPDARACGLVARLLVCRGMALCSVDPQGDADMDAYHDRAHRATDRGYRLARTMVQYRLGHEAGTAAARAKARLAPGAPEPHIAPARQVTMERPAVRAG